MRRLALLIVLPILIPGSRSLAADLPDAADVVKRVQSAPQPAAKGDRANDPVASLMADIKTLSGKAATLPPAEAAEQWLKLFDRYADVPHSTDSPNPRYRAIGRHRFGAPGGAGGVQFTDLLAALPPPAAWENLAKAVAARPLPAGGDATALRERALRVFAALLTSTADPKNADVEKLAKLLIDRDRNDQQARALAEALAEQKPAELVANFESTIEHWTGGRGTADLEVPDLVTLAGREKAQAILRKAVVLPDVALRVSVGEETKALAPQVALKEIDNLKSPQWNLCQAISPDSLALYEALEKKFVTPSTTQPGVGAAVGAVGAPPASQPAAPGLIERLLGAVSGDVNEFVVDHGGAEEGRRQEARGYYLLALVVAGRTDDAVALVKKMPPDQVGLAYPALEQLKDAGHAAEVQAFVHRLLSDDPDLPLWDNYIELSARAGKSDEMLALARQAAARKDLDPKRASATRRSLAKALLAADQIDEGVALLREIVGDQLKAKSPADVQQGFDGAMQAALQMARIGQLLKREPLRDEAITSAEKILQARTAAAPTMGNDYDLRNYYQQLATLLEDVGQPVHAVDLLAQAIASCRDPNQNTFSADARELPIPMLGIYHRAGRHADVLELLRTLPAWNASDLAEIYSRVDSKGTPVGYMAAAALADAKREDEAKTVVNAVLDANGGFDPAYQLLIKLDGPRAMLRFEDLFARDQFEERPLIWKATIQLGPAVDDAEKTIRQAIAIDPSDGEQGKGTRMRAYSVLADVLEKKGDAQQAAIYRGAVKAIRIAEDADDWWEAGLLTRAIHQYEDALTHFQDAYCIQSRLALRMAELGFTEKAEEHYRKAYELMPDSFGRMESHCFGCEGAFRGSSAQKLAEQVFTRMLEKQPDKPQLHYLLGYLREQQGRYKEALAPMQQAVTLDPDYLNAWKHIRDLSRSIYVAPAARDAAALNLMRLDPLGRHVNLDVSMVRDLKGLWAAAAKAGAVHVTPPKSLMALTASAAEVRRLNPGAAEPAETPVADESPATPGAALAGARVVSTVGEILDAH